MRTIPVPNISMYLSLKKIFAIIGFLGFETYPFKYSSSLIE